MTYEQLRASVMEFFGDKSRSQGETKRDLLALSDELQTLADSLVDTDDNEG